MKQAVNSMKSKQSQTLRSVLKEKSSSIELELSAKKPQAAIEEEEEDLLECDNQPVDNTDLIKQLQEKLFTSIAEKEKKIHKVIKTGNFNASQDKIPFWIILPNSRGKIAWDVLIFIMIIVSLLLNPIDIGWSIKCFSNPDVLDTISLILLIFFMVDIAVNCITAVLDEKNIYHFDIILIIKTYIRGFLVIDVMSSLPFERIVPFDEADCFQNYIALGKYLMLCNFIRILKLNKFFLLMEKIFSRYVVYIRLLKIFITILYLSHLIGNLFCGTSQTVKAVIFASCIKYPRSDPGYFECQREVLSKDFISVYFYSVGLGMIMIFGVDIQTKTTFETIFLNITVIISTILNASIYGNVAILLSKVSDVGVSPILREKMDIMTEYLTFMRFDKQFIKNVEEYHLNIWFKQRNMMYDQGFLDDMSAALQKILLLQQWKLNFFKCNQLFSFVSKEFLLDMVVKLNPKIYMAWDIIITEGESTKEVYFLPDFGHCKVYIGGQLVRTLGAGEYFGEIATFLRSRRRTATVIAAKNDEFLYIDGNDFEILMRNFPNDYKEIKCKALRKMIDSMKLYPAAIYARLVPNGLKDYLFRKCIYLENEEEDEMLNNVPRQLVEKITFTQNVDLIEGHLENIERKAKNLMKEESVFRYKYEN